MPLGILRSVEKMSTAASRRNTFDGVKRSQLRPNWCFGCKPTACKFRSYYRFYRAIMPTGFFKCNIKFFSLLHTLYEIRGTVLGVAK